jgi:hypothetical protein
MHNILGKQGRVMELNIDEQINALKQSGLSASGGGRAQSAATPI